jgi:hypothetical protein
MIARDDELGHLEPLQLLQGLIPPRKRVGGVASDYEGIRGDSPDLISEIWNLRFCAVTSMCKSDMTAILIAALSPVGLFRRDRLQFSQGLLEQLQPASVVYDGTHWTQLLMDRTGRSALTRRLIAATSEQLPASRLAGVPNMLLPVERHDRVYAHRAARGN